MPARRWAANRQIEVHLARISARPQQQAPLRSSPDLLVMASSALVTGASFSDSLPTPRLIAHEVPPLSSDSWARTTPSAREGRAFEAHRTHLRAHQAARAGWPEDSQASMQGGLSAIDEPIEPVPRR